MRNLWIGVVVLGLAACAQSPVMAQEQQTSKAEKPAVTQPAVDVFACPMHPEVTAAKAGKCSKCDMALEKKVTKTSKEVKSKPKPHKDMKNEGKEKCGGCAEPCGDQ